MAMSNAPTTPPPNTLATFESGLRKLVAVPKKALDRKVKAFKRRRKKNR
jgi:hypothetical protein